MTLYANIINLVGKNRVRKEDKEGLFPKQFPSQCLWGISLLTAFLGGSPPSFSGSNRSTGFTYGTMHPRNNHTMHLLPL